MSGRILEIDQQILEIDQQIQQLNEDKRRLIEERIRLVGPVQSPEPEPEPVLASPVLPQIQTPPIQATVEGEHIEHGLFPRPEKLGYMHPFKARHFPPPIKDSPPPGWGNHIWRQTLNDPVKVWRCIDKFPHTPFFYTHPDGYRGPRSKPSVIRQRIPDKPYISNNTLYEGAWDEDDNPMEPYTELPEGYDLSELGFLVQIIPNNYPACLAPYSNPIRAGETPNTEPKPIVGVIAGKKLDTNEYVVIIPDIPESSLQQGSQGLRPFEGYNLPSVGYGGSPASRIIHLLSGLGISSDIIKNVYDSQLPNSMSVTCMLCPPITFNGDIYIGCVPWFPEGVRVKWSPDITFRIKTLGNLKEDIDILEGVYKGKIQQPYRDSWGKVFTLHYNPNANGRVLLNRPVHEAYSKNGEYVHYPQFNDLYLVINDEISITTPPTPPMPLRIYCSPFDLVLQPMTGGSSRINRHKRNYRRRRSQRKTRRARRSRKRRSRKRRSYLKHNLN